MKKLWNSLQETRLYLVLSFTLKGLLLGIKMNVLLWSWTLIYRNADRLGIFFVPTLLLYMASGPAILKMMKRHAFKKTLHAALGDEDYFARYPRERKHWERRIARRERKIKLAQAARLKKQTKAARKAQKPSLFAVFERHCARAFAYLYDGSVLGAVSDASILVFARVLLAFSTVCILLHAPLLGVFFAPAVLGYVTLIMLPLCMLEKTREERELQVVVGIEGFREIKREEEKLAFLKRVDREYGKNGPELSDAAFASWCETSSEKTQVVTGKRAGNT